MGDQSHQIPRRILITITSFAWLACPAASVIAQDSATAHGSVVAQSDLVGATLPNAPGFTVASVSSSNRSADSVATTTSGATSRYIVASGIVAPPMASRTQKYIETDQIAPALSAGDKALLGLRAAFSPFEATGWFISADYTQLVNGSPNYGTDRGAYGQRLGAAAVRDTSEGIFSDSVMAGFLHEDPRYYRMGAGHHFLVRLVYSATRPIVGRTDGGRITPNLALLSGTAGGAALTNLYYPQVNRGFSETLQTFGGSLGGSAISDVVSEFYADLKHKIHPGRGEAQ